MKSKITLANKNVAISNVLNRAAHSLSLSEKRILFSAIAKGAGTTSTVTFSAIEYSNTYGMPIKQAYEQLKEAAAHIFERYISLTAEDSRLKRKFRWVEEYNYHEGLGSVTLVFTQAVQPYLLDLQEQFTKYKLSQTSALRSIYSWRLLELLTQQTNNWLIISLEDFHHAMDATETHRANFKDTRKKIIEPAIDELVKKDNWDIGWEPDKKGTRAVQQLKFVFGKNK